jgi:hypothetical protein
VKRGRRGEGGVGRKRRVEAELVEAEVKSEETRRRVEAELRVRRGRRESERR